MAKWKEVPSPEAIVRAALERAAQAVQMCIWGDHWRHDDFGDVEPEELADVIRSFADDPAEVAAILKKAAGGGSGMSDDLVKRYNLDQFARFDGGLHHADMEPCEDGDWVSYADCAKLADRIEKLEAKLDDTAWAVWMQFKHWDGEKKFALREVVKFLKGDKHE